MVGPGARLSGLGSVTVMSAALRTRWSWVTMAPLRLTTASLPKLVLPSAYRAWMKAAACRAGGVPDAGPGPNWGRQPPT